MFIHRWKAVLTGAALIAAVGGTAMQANAQLIASDSYQIGAGGTQTDINTQAANGQYQNNGAYYAQSGNDTTTGRPAVNAFGFAQAGVTNAAGTTVSNGSSLGGVASSNFTTTSTGLQNAAIGAATGTSGKVNWLGVGSFDGTIRSAAHNLAVLPTAAANSSTLFFSYLVQRGTFTANANVDFVGVGYGNAVNLGNPGLGAATTLSGLFTGFSGTNGDLTVRYRNTAGNLAETTLLASSSGPLGTISGTTYLVVLRADLNTSGTGDTITYYLNPTDFTSNASLLNTASASGSFAANIAATPSDIQRLTFFTRNYTQTAFFDEARFGYLGAGVTSPGAALGVSAVVTAPEPGSVAFALLGGVAFVGARRRKRA